MIEHFHFIRPWWLLALVPLVMMLRYLSTLQDAEGRWKGIIAPHLLKHMIVPGSARDWINPIRLTYLTGLISTIVMAGPSWRQLETPFSKDESGMVIALDLSSSMEQKDVQPSRLDRAKQKIGDLLKLRAGSRTGLLVYSGSAHTVIPLTDDPDVIEHFLEALVVDMMPRKGKFPEKILPLAKRMLDESGVSGTVLVIGDGVSPAGIEAFSRYFSENDHLLLVLGIGMPDQGDSNQSNIIPLQQKELQQLARSSSGFYQDLSLDNSDVRSLQRKAKNFLINTNDEFSPWIDDGYYLTFPIGLLILLWFRKGWTLSWD